VIPDGLGGVAGFKFVYRIEETKGSNESILRLIGVKSNLISI